MTKQLAPNALSIRRSILVLLTLAAAVAGAAAGMFYTSPYAPLLVPAVILAALTVVAWLVWPALACYVTLFVVLMPIGLLPPDLQSMLNRGLTVLAFGAWLIVTMSRQQQVFWPLAASLMAGFLVWGLLSLIWAPFLATGWNMWLVYTLRFFLFFVVMLNVIATPTDLDGMLKTLACSGWLLICVGILTLITEGYSSGTRLQILAMNLNDTAILTLLGLPGVLWVSIRASGFRKVVLGALAATYIAAMLLLTALSGSRGGAISLCLSFLALCLWLPTRKWGLLGIGLSVLGALCVPSIFDILAARFALADGSTFLGGREALWQAAVLLIRDNLLSGVGLGNGPYTVLAYLNATYMISDPRGAPIHNPVLTILAETGIVGLALYVGVLINAVWVFFVHWQRAKRAPGAVPYVYYPIIVSVGLGYFASWFKGGGMESDFSYFLLLLLLLLPLRLEASAAAHAGSAAVEPLEAS